MYAPRSESVFFKAISRRQALKAGLCLCCQPASGRALSFDIEEIGSSIFMRRGHDEDANAGNLDAIANIGFIIGTDFVLVTDSGGSLADGKWLRNIIKEKTDKPIKYVVLSHVHPDHMFGAGAFVEDNPVFIGHAKLSEALALRGEFYRKRLVDLIGEGNVGPVIMPTKLIENEDELDLGERVITFHAHGPAHTYSDLSMFDRVSGLFLPADLLFVDRIPALDGSLLGWLKELDTLQTKKFGKAIPGHGPLTVDFKAASQALTDYLTVIRDGVNAVIAKDGSIEQAVATVGLSEEGKWGLFKDYNKRNVTEAFRELEWQ